MKKRNNQKGAFLPFIIVSLIILVIVIVGLMQLLVSLGGSRQATNANDAGNLNVAKCAPLVTVADPDPAFAGVSDDGKFGLTNVNRVWGQALLVNLNERSMELTGTSTAQSRADAELSWNSAQRISSALATKLNQRKNLEPYFTSIANDNRTSLLNSKAHLKPSEVWRTSLMNRNTESNLIYSSAQLPPGITLGSLGNPVIKKGNSTYWKGYTAIPGANGRLIHLVSFESGQAPHRVSLKNFVSDMQKTKPLNWNNPVPNAFESQSSIVDNASRTHTFDSVALCNTKQKYQAAIPSGFIRFTLKQDHAKWFPYYIPGIPPQRNAPKHHTLIVESYIVDPFIWGSWWRPTLNYGAQYQDATGNSLYMALYGMTKTPQTPHLDPAYSSLNNLLLRRANEVKPGTSLDQVCSLLHNKTGIHANQTFVLALDKFENLTIVDTAVPSEVSLLKHPLNLSAAADGAPKTMKASRTDDINKLKALLHFIPNPPPLPPFPCIGIPKSGTTIWTHQLTVTPGTGANGNLLDIEQVDETSSYWYGKI